MDISGRLAKPDGGPVEPDRSRPGFDGSRAGDQVSVTPVPRPAAPPRTTGRPGLREPDRAVVIDHVHAHEMGCYWDHLACQWRCSH